MSFNDLLSQSNLSADDAKVKLLPQASFLARISAANTIPRYWPPKEGKRAEAECAWCYSAQFEIIEYLPTNNDELDRLNLAALEHFGDWRGYKMQDARKMLIPGLGADKVLGAQIGPGVFALFDTSETFDTFLGTNKELARFLELKDDGSIGGFVSKLSQQPKAMVPIELPENPVSKQNFSATIAATEGAFCVLEVGIEKSAEYGDRNIIAGISSVG